MSITRLKGSYESDTINGSLCKKKKNHKNGHFLLLKVQRSSLL